MQAQVSLFLLFFFFQAEDGIRDGRVTGVQTCALPIFMVAAYSILQAALEKISARIAVSEYARRTLVEHLGGDAVVIPNGVDVDFFAKAEPKPEWQGDTIGFVGRIDEPRKGLPVLMKALPKILAARPQTRLLVAGRGDEEAAVEDLPKELRARVEFLGMISDEDK